MANKKIITMLGCTAIAASLVLAACGGDKEETSETTTEATTVEQTEETRIPYDVDNNTEFEEPILYEVTKEVDAYSDVSASEVGKTLPEGACVSGVSTDGYYIMLDDGNIVEAEYLTEME